MMINYQMKLFNKTLMVCAALLSSASLTFAQETDGQAWLKDLSSRITISGFIQGGYTATHQNGKNTNGWDMKRAIIIGRARVTDRWSFFVMHDLSSVLQEFYTDFRLTKDKSINVRFGQFKTALSIENSIAPPLLELVDVCSQPVTYLAGCGSDPLYGINYGRDMGVDIYGELFGGKLLYDVEVMNGRGVNKRDEDNKKDVIVRLDYRPVEGLRLVASAQKGYGTAFMANDFVSSVYLPAENAIAKGETCRRDRWTLGFEYKQGNNDYWKNRSTTLRGEVLGGRDGKTNSWGGYLTASVPLAGQFDVVASYDYFNYAKGYNHDRTQLVVGLQYWFFRRCRFQAQYTWSDTSTLGLNGAWLEKPMSRLQLQTQIAF